MPGIIAASRYLILLLMVSAGLIACAPIPSGAEHGAPGFASNKPYLNDSNSAFGVHASVQFPTDAVTYYSQLKIARTYMRADNCPAALARLNEAITQYKDDGNVWGLLGKCRAALKQWESAADAYQRALALGFSPTDKELDINPNDLMVEIARLYARAGDDKQALQWLQQGLEARFDERPTILQDEAFANLRQDQRFQLLAGTAPAGITSRDEQWRYDIEFLRKQVALLHIDPDHHTSAANLEQKLNELSRAVARLTDEQITARIDLFIGALGAGHDLFWPASAKRGELIPFAWKLYFFNDGLYIIDAYDPALIGSRIEFFGSTPTKIAYDKVVAAFPGDNELQARWMAVRHLSQAETLQALEIVEDASRVVVQATNSDGKHFSFTPERKAFTPMSPALIAPPNIDAPLYLSRVNHPFWSTQLKKMNAIYLQLNAISNSEEETFERFSERLQRELTASKASNLILDLRHSAGGNGYLTAPLLRTLIHFDASPHTNLFVIIGRNTFSASHNLIVDLDRIAQPIFVGEPSGSRPNALSEAGRFTLPFSGLSGLLSSQLHQHSWPEDHRLWIAPDIPVGLSSTEYFSGIDPAINAIQALLKQKATQDITL